MIGLKMKREKSKLCISKELFSEHSVKSTIEAYKSIATIELNDTRTHYVLWFSNCIYGRTDTIHNFENYLIDLNNQGSSYDSY